MAKDTNIATQPMSSFNSEEEILSYVNEQVGVISATPPIRNKPLDEMDTLVGYLVEFPIYTSFPPTGFISERIVSKVRCWVMFSVRYKTVPIATRSEEVGRRHTIDLAYFCILIIPQKLTAFKQGDTHVVYDFAEEIANEYIFQYKLLPGRHHHDLRLLNNTNEGALGLVRKLRIKPIIELDQVEGLFLNSGILNLSGNRADLTPDEMSLIGSSLGNANNVEIWQQVQKPLYRLIQAYDANCYGDADGAITLASSSIEGFLMVSERIVRVYHKGENEQMVENQIRRKSLSDLLAYAHAEYGLNIDKSTQRTAYGNWHSRCYKKRNNYIHKQHSHTPNDSRPALVSTAKFISHIATLMERRYSKYSQIAYFVKLVTKSLR